MNMCKYKNNCQLNILFKIKFLFKIYRIGIQITEVKKKVYIN